MTFDSHLIALAASVVITVASHVILKAGATRYEKKLNLFNFVGLSGFGLVTILVVYALQAIELKTMMAGMALTYLLTPLTAKFVLNESVSKRQLAGSVVVLAGVIVFFAGG